MQAYNLHQSFVYSLGQMSILLMYFFRRSCISDIYNLVSYNELVSIFVFKP